MHRAVPALLLLLPAACSGRRALDEEPSIQLGIEMPREVYYFGRPFKITVYVHCRADVPVEIRTPESLDGGLELSTSREGDPDLLTAPSDIDFPKTEVWKPGETRRFEYDLSEPLKAHITKDRIFYLRWRCGKKKTPWSRVVATKDYVADVDTSLGPFTIEFMPGQAPETVFTFIKRAREGFYDGSSVFQVRDDVMVVGDPLRTDVEPVEHRLTKQIEEFGTVGMWYETRPADANHLWYVRFKGRDYPQPPFCVFGRVIKGEETIRKIQKVEVDEKLTPKHPIRVNKVSIRVRE